MKKALSVILTLCLFANISFAAFNPYADEEVEKKSYKKLYYGIALTLLGGFLVYDGFSKVEVDVSKPSVDYTTVLHSEWNHGANASEHDYILSSGYSPYPYSPKDSPRENPIYIEQNVLYNNGNVDLYNITIEVRYNDRTGHYIKDSYPSEHPNNGDQTSNGYHVAKYTNEGVTETYEGISLDKGKSITWRDIWEYRTDDPNENSPLGDERAKHPEEEDPLGLHLGKDALGLMTIRVKLNKKQQYKPIYEKRNKCDAEGVAGILVGLTGIYFIVDHFLDMHKFNAYAKRHHLNLRLTTASNEYKLMLQKRI